MPSDYEPCGLTQMHALKYGTVPLVRSVGGLKDTVQEFKKTTASGTGFKFKTDGKNHLLRTLDKALSVYQNQKSWKRLMETGMAQDFSWRHSAGKYLRLYQKALRK
jgi:starch synthase